MKNKKILLILIFIFLFSCQTSNNSDSNESTLNNNELSGSIDIGKINSRTDYNVLLYLSNIPAGVSSFISTSANLDLIEIKSIDKSNFTILDITAISLVEAINTDNTTNSYMLQTFNVNTTGLEKCNEIVIDGTILLSDLINVAQNYITSKNEGSPNPPNPKDFEMLRTAYLYNIKVKDSENNEYILQPCFETFRKSSDL